MRTRTWMLVGAASAAALWWVPPVSATITSVGGSVSVQIQEFVSNSAGDFDQASKTLPGTADAFPLQVVARLLSQTQKAGGLASAQLENPLTSTTENPEDFALALVVDSLTPTTRYTSTGTVQEVRDVLYSPNEIPGALNGERVRFTGKFFLDGALAIFATTDATDLTGANASVQVTVVQVVPGAADTTIFDGTLTVTGGTDRQVQFTAAGNLPTARIVDTDLSSLNRDLGVLRVIVLPNLVLDYPYDAIIGQEFTFRATITVTLANRPDGVGVAGVFGFPLNTVSELLNLTRAAATAKTINDAIINERANPTGAPAFPARLGLFPSCGLMGVESLLGVAGLLGLCAQRARRVIR